jgi:hypothetical protein
MFGERMLLWSKSQIQFGVNILSWCKFVDFDLKCEKIYNRILVKCGNLILSMIIW